MEPNSTTETTTTSAGSVTFTLGDAQEMVEIVIRCDYEGPLWFEDVTPETRLRALGYPNMYRIVKVSKAILECWRGAFRTFELVQAQIQAVYEQSAQLSEEAR